MRRNFLLVVAVGLVVLGAPWDSWAPSRRTRRRADQKVLPNDRFQPAEAMDRHVEAFLEMLAAERGAARNTLLACQADLADFAAFAAAEATPPASGRGGAAGLAGRPAPPGWRRAPRRGNCPRYASSIASCCARAYAATTPRRCSTRPACRGAAEIPDRAGGGRVAEGRGAGQSCRER